MSKRSTDWQKINDYTIQHANGTRITRVKVRGVWTFSRWIPDKSMVFGFLLIGHFSALDDAKNENSRTQPL